MLTQLASNSIAIGMEEQQNQNQTSCDQAFGFTRERRHLLPIETK